MMIKEMRELETSIYIRRFYSGGPIFLINIHINGIKRLPKGIESDLSVRREINNILKDIK